MALRTTPWRQWIIPSDRVDKFDFANGGMFWKEGICVQMMKDRGNKSLIAGMVAGCIKFAEVDWSAPNPQAETIKAKEQLTAWLG